ncbi:MAG: hypothetical protein GXP63_07550 [DPANN group archaeon]|nr:hypothetical protein [DPANN group archaeon]
MKKLLTLVVMLLTLSSFAYAGNVSEVRTNKPTFSTLMLRDYYTGSEFAYSQENSVTAFLTMENQGCGVFNDLHVTILIYDLDYRRKFSSFDLCNQRDRENFRLPIVLPRDTAPGYYPVRITVSNDDVTRVRHRWLFVQ